MPTYEYVCKKCDHNWELFQSITAGAIRKCPNCGKLSAKRVIGPGAGFLFKGSGFYITDYRSDAYKKAASADKKANGAADKGSTDKSTTDKPKKPESGSSGSSD